MTPQERREEIAEQIDKQFGMFLFLLVNKHIDPSEIREALIALTLRADEAERKLEEMAKKWRHGADIRLTNGDVLHFGTRQVHIGQYSLTHDAIEELLRRVAALSLRADEAERKLATKLEIARHPFDEIKRLEESNASLRQQLERMREICEWLLSDGKEIVPANWRNELRTRLNAVLAQKPK